MQLQRHQVNAGDPLAVYRFVRESLRGGAAQAAAVELEDPPPVDRALKRRALVRMTPRLPTRPPATEGIGFRDRFRNRFVERYWRQVGTWTEAQTGATCTATQVGAFPLGQMYTSADTYADVDLSGVIAAINDFGARTGYLIARLSTPYPAALTAYLWYYDLATGSYQLDRFDGGLGTALAFGNIGAGTAPVTLRLTVQGGTLTGYIDGVDLTGPVVDGTPLAAGAVGVGFSGSLNRFNDFVCTVL